MDGMTPIERAARALCKADGHDPDGSCPSSCGDPYWMFYAAKVRAVLTAIREPSEVMVAHGFLDMGVARCDISTIYTAMIDAMLEEG